MDLEQTIAAIKITKKMGIKTHLTFTFGIPGETRRSIEKTISLALALDPETVQFSIATPFPGTKFYTEAKQNGEIVSENWLEYDGNRHSVIEYKNIKRNELKRAVKLAYRRWAEHCAQRRRYKGSGYYRLFLSSLKKNGLYTTCRKGLGSLFCSFSEKVSSAEELEKKAGETGLRAGRMMMLSGNGGLRLYWDGEELTRSSGFSSAINLPSAKSPAAALNRWEVKKVSESELLLCRAHSYLPGEEIWRIKVVDEKQIDWEVEISLKDKIETLAGKIMLILSSRYRTWVDCWGEGRFYPLNDYRKIRLRNPGSEVIGVRGRKKLKGELPTIFLDLSRNEGECLPSIQNARSTLGARVLAAQTKISNGHSREFPDTHKLFSVRIKIVEEDFRKRKANK